MSDLVGRLREYAVAVTAGRPTINGLPELLGEAAAEIERLQTKLDALTALAGAVSIGPDYKAVAKDARHDLPVTEITRDA